MVVFGRISEVIDAVLGPLICDQFPVPISGVLAAMVTTVPQTSCVGPASDGVGGAEFVILTWSPLLQPPWLMVQTKTYNPGTAPLNVAWGE